MQSNKLLNFIILIFIIAALSGLLGFVNLNLEKSLSYGMMIYGIISAYIAFGTNKKGQIFSGAILFLSGILIYVINNYEFADYNLLFLPSLIFIFGAAFLILFLDDISNKAFLAVGIVLPVISGGLIYTMRNFKIAEFIGTLSGVLFVYYPVFLILIGMNLILNRGD